MERFKVTFTDDSNKYSPTTRTVEVDASDEYHAELLVHSQFGTYKKAEGIKGLKNAFLIPSEKHIHVDKVKKVKKEKR